MGSNYKNIVKTMISDLLNNKLWRLWCPDEHLRCWIEKKNLREQNFEGEANNKLLDEEDTQRSNLNSKYLSLTLVLNVLILWFTFIVLHTCKVRCDIAIRSPSKRSRSVKFQQLSRLFLSNKKQHDK